MPCPRGWGHLAYLLLLISVEPDTSHLGGRAGCGAAAGSKMWPRNQAQQQLPPAQGVGRGLVSSFTAKWVCGGRIRALGFETKAFVPRRAAVWHVAAGISLSHVLLAEGFPRWLCPEVVLSLVVSCFTGGSENPERGSGCVSPSSHGMTDMRFPSLVRKIARHWDFCPVEGTRHCVPC